MDWDVILAIVVPYAAAAATLTELVRQVLRTRLHPVVWQVIAAAICVLLAVPRLQALPLTWGDYVVLVLLLVASPPVAHGIAKRLMATSLLKR